MMILSEADFLLNLVDVLQPALDRLLHTSPHPHPPPQSQGQSPPSSSLPQHNPIPALPPHLSLPLSPPLSPPVLTAPPQNATGRLLKTRSRSLHDQRTSSYPLNLPRSPPHSNNSTTTTTLLPANPPNPPRRRPPPNPLHPPRSLPSPHLPHLSPPPHPHNPLLPNPLPIRRHPRFRSFRFPRWRAVPGTRETMEAGGGLDELL
ncbi:hypothetical protein BC829DRAFT_282062 [Chytridium lagenaria]|nr:hypothetical protein BC829DRAFT_282062 [Chytridium lagenaria]